MAKKILVLTGSPRRGGNSDLMAEAFADGAKSAGHQVDIFKAGQKKIGGCIHCKQCYKKGKPCALNDDFDELAPLVEQAQVLVLASPVYFFSFNAQIKAAIDRFYCFLKYEESLKIKECYLLSCAGDDVSSVFDGAIKPYEEIYSYLGWEDKGRLLVRGVNRVGEIKNTDALQKAKEMGAGV